jgi:CRISPR-associated protein (TIGR02584 family)
MRAITSNDTINQYLLTEIEKYQIEIERIKKLTFEYKISNKELNTLLSEVNYFASIDNLNKIKNMLVIIKGLFDKEASSYMKDQSAKAIADIKTLEKNYSISNKICYLVCHNQDLKNVIAALNEEVKTNNTYLYIALNIFNDKIQYSLVASKNSDTIDASEIIKKINLISNGSGGGNKFYAQGGTNDINSCDKILETIKNN